MYPRTSLGPRSMVWEPLAYVLSKSEILYTRTRRWIFGVYKTEGFFLRQMELRFFKLKVDAGG
jgi:hypothetical protein